MAWRDGDRFGMLFNCAGIVINRRKLWKKIDTIDKCTNYRKRGSCSDRLGTISKCLLPHPQLPLALAGIHSDAQCTIHVVVVVSVQLLT